MGILRLIQEWLDAGVVVDGNWPETATGTPQGAVVSRLLSNGYWHAVLDQWKDQ
jgi:RNA-directed DNA polymerase